MCLWKHRYTHATQISQIFQTQVDIVGIQYVPCLHFKHWPDVSCPLLQWMQPTETQDTDRAVFLHYSMLVLELVTASLPLTFNKVLSLSVGKPCLGFKRGEKEAWYGICYVQCMCEKERASISTAFRGKDFAIFNFPPPSITSIKVRLLLNVFFFVLFFLHFPCTIPLSFSLSQKSIDTNAITRAGVLALQ